MTSSPLQSSIVDLTAKLPPAADHPEGDAVVAALLAMHQAMSAAQTPLSAPFLRWACHAQGAISAEGGVDPVVALRVLQEMGVCIEARWPAGGGWPLPELLDAALADAAMRRITGYELPPPTDWRPIRAAITTGRLALVKLPRYEHWQSAWQSIVRKRLRRPLPGEDVLTEAVFVVAGYCDDAQVPGGGYFIARAYDRPVTSSVGTGDCYLPYSLIDEQNLLTVVIEGVTHNPDGAMQGTGTQSSLPTIDPGRTTVLVSQSRFSAMLQAAGYRVTTANSSISKWIETNPTAVYDIWLLSEEDLYQVTLEQVKKHDPGAQIIIVTLQVIPDPVAAAHERGVFAVLTEGYNLAERVLAIVPLAAAYSQARQSAPDRPEPLWATAMHTRVAQHVVPRVFQLAESGHVWNRSGAEKLAEARWALVVNTLEDSALLRALEPLLRWRAEQQGIRLPELTYRDGEDCGTWMSRHSDGFKQTLRDHWGQIPPVLLYRPGEDTVGWLGRHGTMQGAVDPRRGVPYYLALVGRPGPLNDDDETTIPFEFQYDLDISWGVGRICFTGPDGQHRLEGYRRYAELLVQQERSPVPPRRHAVFFAPQHEDDRGTMRSLEELIRPMVEGRYGDAGLAQRNGYSLSAFLQADASRANFERILRGSIEGGRPDLLFIASHGMGLPLTDERLVMHQGAPVLQDWSGFGNVKREHWLAANELPANLHLDGMIAFMFVAYGGGTPRYDDFIFDEHQSRPQIAPFDLVAQFPQELLLRGTLGVVAHIDRAWTYSFTDPSGTKGGTVLEEVAGNILLGQRVGRATEPINMRYAALGNQLSDLFSRLDRTDPTTFMNIAMARTDLRNYIVLGDPAVHLRPDLDRAP